MHSPTNSDLRELGDAATTAWSSGQKAKHTVSENTREGLELITSETRHKRGSVVVTMS